MTLITNNGTGSLYEMGEKETYQIDKDALYYINWNSLESVNDLIIIFAAIGFNFSPHHPHFETIKRFLDLKNPIKTSGLSPIESK